jgi:hypothetical protein
MFHVASGVVIRIGAARLGAETPVAVDQRHRVIAAVGHHAPRPGQAVDQRGSSGLISHMADLNQGRSRISGWCQELPFGANRFRAPVPKLATLMHGRKPSVAAPVFAGQNIAGKSARTVEN